MMEENGPTTPNCTFMYDAAVYYDEFDPKKAEIQKLRDKLEHSRWGFSICDPHRDGQGEQMKRFKQSFLDSRHAIVFLSPDVLERMNTNREDGVEYKMLTFLAGILESHDIKLKRRLIPVVFGIGDGKFQKPFLLSDFSLLCPEKKGFNRHLYRSLSKLPAQQTITQRQIRQRVDAVGRDRYTDGVVTMVSAELDIPEDVLKDIKKEYGGHKAMLVEVLECWRLHRGPEATATVLDSILARVAAMPLQSFVESPGIAETMPSPPMSDTTDHTDGQRWNKAHVHVEGSGNIIVLAGDKSTIELCQNYLTQAASTQDSPEQTVQADGAGNLDLDTPPEVGPSQGVASASTRSTGHEEVFSDGAGNQDLDTPPEVGTTQGASATHPKEFYSLPATTERTDEKASATCPKEFYSLPDTTERTEEKGVRATIRNLFQRFSLKSTPDNKDKETRKFTRQERSDDTRPMQRFASTYDTVDGNNGSPMLSRRSSLDSGTFSTMTAQESIKEEERLASSLPDPPSHKVEEKKNEKTQKKKGKTSPAPLADT